MIGGIYRDFSTVPDIAFVLFQIDTHRDGVILAIVLVVGWRLSIVFMSQIWRANE